MSRSRDTADQINRVDSSAANATAITIDASENVGIGCVPSPIQSGFDTLQIGGNLTLNVDSTGAGAGVYMGNNVYRDSTNSRWEYINTDEASQYLQANGTHVWRTAASGTADTAITWSEAMRIDGGNVLVGKTSADNTTDGATLWNDGTMSFTANLTNPAAGRVAVLNRRTADGAIVDFRKDGTTVGSIGTEAGSLRIGAPQHGDSLIFVGEDTAGTETRLAMVNGTGTEAFRPFNSYSDAKYDLGRDDRRFKDLYLSGGVYLGGTGAANKLDDYEEGSWTPAIQYQSGGPNTANQKSGSYTKIGGLVNVNGMILCGNTNSGSGQAYLAGLPFTVTDVVANTSVEANGTVGYFANLGTAVNTITFGAIHNTNRCELYVGTLSSSAVGGDEATFNSGAHIRFSLTYYTSS